MPIDCEKHPYYCTLPVMKNSVFSFPQTIAYNNILQSYFFNKKRKKCYMIIIRLWIFFENKIFKRVELVLNLCNKERRSDFKSR